jgi:hypothetical protein
MGRNAKRKADRRAKTITLSGEQAEVFDEQMDSDRDWFEGSNECVRFRPEIPGEFNEQLMLGGQPPYIQIFDLKTGEDIDATLDWVCVVDIIRAIEGGGPSGCRTRLRCPAPINGQIRQSLANYAISFAQGFIQTLKAQP